MEELRCLQLTQLEILKVCDTVCRKNDIHYSLYAGTLLGAVRHKGFIPWDDDLDICMERNEYDRFLRAWQQDPPEGYLLQNKENTPFYMNSFAKVRKDHTTYLEHERDIGNMHTGIFVDIFPMDRLPDGKLKRVRFYWDVMVYQLMQREYVPEKASKLVRLGSKLLLAAVPKGKRAKVARRKLNRITAYNSDPSLPVVSIETTALMKKGYRPDLMSGFVELPFEDGTFQCVSCFKDMLQVLYGDYMQLPPEEERTWRHHPMVIDFEHNYEELQ